MHSRSVRFRLGRVWVVVCAEDESVEGIRVAESQMEILGRLLRGIGSREDVETLAAVLNGPTLDERFSRKDAPPCGCRGKVFGERSLSPLSIAVAGLHDQR